MGENLAIVRARGQKPLIRAILSQEPGSVLVCMPEHADAIRRGERSSPMIAFAEKDVFRCDKRAAQAIKSGAPLDWSRLQPLEAAN